MKSISENYLVSIRKQFAYYKALGDRTIAQLTDEEVSWNPGPEDNNVAIIVKHLWGNMKSRWTDFLDSDGEKEWRDRDGEFVSDIRGLQELREKWEDGWSCLFRALDGLTISDLSKLVYVRNQGHTVVEAINRQLAHYSYHVGQLVYLGKMARGRDWDSLSIPRGESSQYNRSKFSAEKKKQHFTDEFL